MLGRLLASGGYDRSVRLWDVATCTQTARLDGHTDQVLVVAFSPDGRLLANAGHDGLMALWDVDVAAGTQTVRLDSQRLGGHGRVQPRRAPAGQRWA